MEQKKCDESRQGSLEFRSKKILSECSKSVILSSTPVCGLQGKGISEIQALEANIVSQTPEKTSEPLQAKVKKEEFESLEKYKTVLEFFDSMNSSLRLLNLGRKSRTFQNICTQVGVLTKRVFSYRHLAQMKYILPESIKINKILIHDKETLCMKPDLEITLLFDVVEGHCEYSDYAALRKVFVTRLISFCDMHPEACDIPEAILPEPFNQREQNGPVKPFLEELKTESQVTSNESELFARASHICPSFGRHFSPKIVASDREESQILSQPSLNFARPSNLDDENFECMPLRELSSASDNLCSKDTGTSSPKESVLCSDSSTIKSFVTNSLHPVSANPLDSPQIKLPSADDLKIETPAQLAPKRSIPSCDKQKTVTSQKGDSHLKPAKRFLDFSVMQEDTSSLGSVEVSKCRDDTHVRLFEPQETAGYFQEHAADSSKSPQKVETSCSLSDDNMSQKSLEAQQPSSASVAELVRIVFHIFQSTNFSLITKEELLHKIIMNSLDIVEKREAEDQLELLEKLFPDWISWKSGPGGDILYNIKKVGDLDSIGRELSLHEWIVSTT